MKITRFAVLAAAMSCMLGAAPIGTLDIAGLGPVRVSASAIDFSPFGPAPGTFVVSDTAGSYTDLAIGNQGTVQDLNDPPATPGSPLAMPIADFILVPTPGAIFSFNVEEIFGGLGTGCTPAPAVGESCSPTNINPNSPFILTQNQGAVTASFSLRGTVTDLRDNTTAVYIGLFTANLTQASQDTIPEVLNLLTTQGYVQSSWSAQLTSTAIPEPSTLTMFCAAGLFSVAALLRRRVKNQ